MNNQKVFCEECRRDAIFTVSTEKLSGTVKGNTYSFVGRVAHCKDCKNEVYVGTVNDFNLKALYEVYRKANDIISLDTVLKLSLKYKIGKRPLSLLLGWGEQTFSRYCEGDVPTKQYSNMLKRIYEDPAFYEQILEKNSRGTITDAAYRRSKKAVTGLLAASSREKSKINLVIEYLLQQCEDITPLALQKSLYYVQGFYYAFYDSFLFAEDCEAWVHGPVYREVYFRYQNYRFDSIRGNATSRDIILSPSEHAVLDSVVKNICCYSGKVLENMTHLETPWLSARGEISNAQLSNQLISKEAMGIYFKAVKEKYQMNNPIDIGAYARTMFESI